MIAVDVRVLGPLEVVVDGQPLALGGTRPRSVLAVLAFDANRVVSVERIVDAVWGDGASDNAQGTLQVHVSNLRRALAPAAERLGQADVVVTRKPGYLLDLPAGSVDLERAQAFVVEARDLASTAPTEALARLDDALALWRGEALADLADQPFARSLAVRVAALRTALIDDRIEIALELGRHLDVLAELTHAVAEDPTNERRRGLQMLALYRAGRQKEALDAYRELRVSLLEELGLDPSPMIRELESRILSQDPTLDPARPTATGRLPVLDLATVVGSSVLAPTAALVLDGVTLPLTTPVTTIGRRVDCGVVLDDVKASRTHAEVRLSGGVCVLVDQRSTNGTYVNGRRISEQQLHDGDEIRIGSTTLRFTCSSD